ncbi:MAG TPA: FHA domain-containing protein [Polyangiales bacterium]|nr:FHA domain-containing protein [Polyangiales bacterium]
MSTRELIELARSLPREEFIAKVPARFLVLGTGNGNDNDQPLGFSTQVFKAPSLAPLAQQELVVLPIVKAANNPYPDRVSVGRARNCDIVIRDAGISKLHALVRIDADAFSVVDVGSQNGTFVNGKRLLDNEAAPLTCNDRIIFGTVAAQFMDGGGVHDELNKVAI